MYFDHGFPPLDFRRSTFFPAYQQHMHTLSPSSSTKQNLKEVKTSKKDKTKQTNEQKIKEKPTPKKGMEFILRWSTTPGQGD